MDEGALDCDKTGLPPIRPDFVPAEDYTDPSVTRLENERLFPRTWQIVCREEEVPKIGDYVNFQLNTESILVVRIAESKIKAFYNVCQHRGRRLVDKPKGNVGLHGFYCRFHGWRYHLDGSNAYVHMPEDWQDCASFKQDDLGLKQPRIGFWAGWVWINMDPNAISLEKYLHPIPDIMKNFEFEKLRFTWYETIIAPINWKVVVEAFNEGYHSMATHPYSVDKVSGKWPAQAFGIHSMYNVSYGELPRILEGGVWKKPPRLVDFIYAESKDIHERLHAMVTDGNMRAIGRLREEVDENTTPEDIARRTFELQKEELEKTGAEWPPNLTLDDVNKAGLSWHVFPNTLFLPTVDGLLWYRFRPFGDDPDKCIFDIWCLGRYPKGKEPKVEQHISNGFEEFRGRCPFLEDDFENMVATNAGMKSRGWAGARTNCVQEVAVNHFHRLLRRYLYGAASESLAAE